MLKAAFGYIAVGKTQTFDWFSCFKHGETLVEDCEHSGCPSTGHTDVNMEKDCKIVSEDQQSTILESAGRAGLCCGTCQ
jgi:hypothetical protein